MLTRVTLSAVGAALFQLVAVTNGAEPPDAPEPEICDQAEVVRSRQRLSIARQEMGNQELRWLANLVECHDFRSEEYPGPTPGVVGVTWLKDKFPESFGDFPEHDAWGEPFQYWSDGYHYVVISFSADRRADKEYDQILARPWDEAKPALCGGRTSDLSVDLVFAESNNCQWYEESSE